MREIKDYLHYYLGCEVLLPDGTKDILDYVEMGQNKYWLAGTISGAKTNLPYKLQEIKIILRPLSDMSEEEAKELLRLSGKGGIIEIGTIVIKQDWTDVQYLLSKHFDLFDLIEAGVAIDKTKLKQ